MLPQGGHKRGIRVSSLQGFRVREGCRLAKNGVARWPLVFQAGLALDGRDGRGLGSMQCSVLLVVNVLPSCEHALFGVL